VKRSSHVFAITGSVAGLVVSVLSISQLIQVYFRHMVHRYTIIDIHIDRYRDIKDIWHHEYLYSLLKPTLWPFEMSGILLLE